MGIKFVFEKDKPEKTKEVRLHLGKIKLKKIIPKIKKSKSKKGFVINWESELGLRENPFKNEIYSPVSNFIVGLDREKEKLNMFILEDNKFGMITGDKGTGKTTLLKWLEEQLDDFGDKIVTIFIDGNDFRDKQKFLKLLTEPFKGFKMPFKKEKETVILDSAHRYIKNRIGNRVLVILVDGINDLKKEELILFDRLFSSVSLRLIITGEKGLLSNLNEAKSFQDINPENYSNKLKIVLDGLSPHETIAMIRKRITHFGGKDIYPFDEEQLKKITKEAEKNPLKILESCNKTAMKLAVKKAEGGKVEDLRSYQKEGIKLDKGEEAKDLLSEDTKKKKSKEADYKIKVVKQGHEPITIKDSSKKSGTGYVINKVK